jgi:signal transduction histidine kinase
VQITQEGLVNIRKHSGAQHGMVRFDGRNDCYRLSLEDDGGGFHDLTGRFNLADLESMGKGPLVIRERVRLIGADLTLESDPSRGTRLEVRVPRHREAENGQ